MKQLATRLAGAMLVAPEIHEDARGFFVETFRADAYRSLGIGVSFIQDNHSRSLGGTLRGLHFQTHPGQAKLVRCVRGAIRDVIVDLRLSSPTFGEHEAFSLDDALHHQLFVPVGFAHGFCVVSKVADVVYKVGSYYDAETERGIAWDDPELAIRWPTPSPVISERDQRHPRLSEIVEMLPDW